MLVDRSVLITRLALLVLLAVIVLPIVAGVAGVYAQSIVVDFDKSIYDRDDVVAMSIYGFTPPTKLAIEVYSPEGELVWIHEDSASTTPFETSFRLPGTTAPDGYYTVFIAVEGSNPIPFKFLVKRPTFDILVVEPTSIEVYPGEDITLNVKVSNTGARGSVVLQVRLGAETIVKSIGPTTLGYGQESTLAISFDAPSTPGTYTYSITAWNTKYGIVDDSVSITVIVKALPIPAPPPPPPPTPTPTPATITPTITAPMPPEARAVYVADIGEYVTEEGVIVNPVKIIVPEEKVEVLIPSGTRVTDPQGNPVKPRVIVIEALKEPPKAEAGEVVGPAYNIRADIGPVVFDKPITITLPYDPGKVMPGYTVRLAYYDEERGVWATLPTILVDPLRGRVIGTTTHFTIFAAIAYRVVTPVTLTQTVTVTETVVQTTTVTETEVVTTTATKVETRVEKETVTATVTVTQPPITVTETVERVETTTVPIERTKTITAVTRVPVTEIRTTTATVTATHVTTVTTPTTVTLTKPVPPWWSYVAIVIAVIAVVAAIVITIKYGRRG